MATRTWVGTTSENWGTASNWLEGSVPVTGDDVHLLNNAVNVSAGLDQHTVTLNSLTIDLSYVGTIGAAGIASTSYLQIGCSGVVTIGATGANGSRSAGSGRLNLNFGSTTPTSINVLGSANGGTDTGQPPVRIKGSALAIVNIIDGVVGIANEPSEAATATTVSVGLQDQASFPTVYLGRGTAITKLIVANGSCIDWTDNYTDTVTVLGGVYIRKGGGQVGTLNAKGGAVYPQGTGTITNMNVSGNVDFSGDTRGKSVTYTTVVPGASINARNGGGVTFVSGILLQHCDLPDVNLQIGNNYTLFIS